MRRWVYVRREQEVDAKKSMTGFCAYGQAEAQFTECSASQCLDAGVIVCKGSKLQMEGGSIMYSDMCGGVVDSGSHGHFKKVPASHAIEGIVTCGRGSFVDVQECHLKNRIGPGVIAFDSAEAHMDGHAVEPSIQGTLNFGCEWLMQ